MDGCPVTDFYNEWSGVNAGNEARAYGCKPDDNGDDNDTNGSAPNQEATLTLLVLLGMIMTYGKPGKKVTNKPARGCRAITCEAAETSAPGSLSELPDPLELNVDATSMRSALVISGGDMKTSEPGVLSVSPDLLELNVNTSPNGKTISISRVRK